jgi:predicted AAA+ superfamily ATPase
MPETQTTNPPTFESVWAALMEDREHLKETAQIVKENAESLKETERLMKEDSQRLKEELNIKIGALTNLFGDLTEGMVAPKICEKFEEIGLFFPKASRNIEFIDKVNNISLEVDIVLEDGDKAMLIEVKTKLTEERIDKHIQRLEKMRKYADLHGDKRIFLGAVAGIVVTDEIRDYALSQGLYFIEYAGETFYITPPKDKPKEW